MDIFRGSCIPAVVCFESSMRCAQCGTYLTHAQENYLVRFTGSDDRKCRSCGIELHHSSIVTDILPSSEHFLDPANAKNSFWYHATDRSDWMGDLMADKDEKYGSFPLVHVGTLDAAFSMIAENYVLRDDWIFLYTVRLAPSAVVDDLLYEDENMWPSRTDQVRRDASAFRYVNRYEATGSISLLADPRELVIEGMGAMTPWQAEDVIREREVFGAMF